MAEQIPSHMSAVQLVGHGGIDMLQYRDDVPTPTNLALDEVLIRVKAAAVNNTDLNTRIGWYSKTVSSGTCNVAAGSLLDKDSIAADASWSGVPMKFPRIQGADCCGRIVAVGRTVDPSRIGQRVIVRSLMHVGNNNDESYKLSTLGSECDGAFAQYLKVPALETYHVNCDWTDVELASIPCAYSTAEGMLHRARVGRDERVLITGASGGVGSAAVQLAKRRGAHVIAATSEAKAQAVRDIGADETVDRHADIVAALGNKSVDVIVDLVVGEAFSSLLDILRRGGRYVTAGAIAGPIVELDVRTLYLKDLTFYGCTYQEDVVFENLVKYIEAGEIKPLVAKTFPLRDIGLAQEEFLEKKFIGKLVLIPPE